MFSVEDNAIVLAFVIPPLLGGVTLRKIGPRKGRRHASCAVLAHKTRTLGTFKTLEVGIVKISHYVLRMEQTKWSYYLYPLCNASAHVISMPCSRANAENCVRHRLIEHALLPFAIGDHQSAKLSDGDGRAWGNRSTPG